MKGYRLLVKIMAFLSSLFFIIAFGQSPKVVQLDGGQTHLCALLEDGSVYCWGRLDWLGVGDFEGVWTPTQVEGLENVAQVSSGVEHFCVRKNDSTVWCLGDGANGRLGNGSEENSNVPVQVVGISTAVRVVSGLYHSCASLADGSVYCWGKGGELGVDSFANAPQPVQVEGLTDILDIAIANGAGWTAGRGSTCALARGGQVSCWGENREGALGTGDIESSRTPIAGLNIPGAKRIYGGGQHFCVTTDAGEVYCWGANYDGQLGNGNRGEIQTGAMKVQGLSDITALALGDSFTCALDSSGNASCWGNNSVGQLGRGYRNVLQSDPGNPLLPDAVGDVNGVAGIGAGNRTACAYSSDGTTYCWGTNEYGTIGNGTASTQDFQLTPTPVTW